MSLEISEEVKFDVEKKQLYYQSEYYDDARGETDAYNSVNRYALVRKDNGKLLGIHSGEYIVRPYYELAEKVNKVVEECVDIDKYHITTKDHVYESGKKYRRDINFWDDAIDMQNYDKNGMHNALNVDDTCAHVLNDMIKDAKKQALEFHRDLYKE